MVNIIGIPIYDRSLRGVVEELISLCSDPEKQNRCVSATGAHGLVETKRDPHFGNLLKNFFLNLPDGMPGVWIGRLKGAREMERCYGPDVFREILTRSAGTTIRHYLCGGTPEMMAALKSVVERNFNNYNVVGTWCPPFVAVEEMDYETIGRDVVNKRADIVWVGLSTPKQEYFAAKLSSHTQTQFIITVGAAFDFHAGRLAQAPPIVQKMGLEWLFRLCVEPDRLWRRYAVVVPLFIVFNFLDFIFNGKGKK